MTGADRLAARSRHSKRETGRRAEGRPELRVVEARRERLARAPRRARRARRRRRAGTLGSGGGMSLTHYANGGAPAPSSAGDAEVGYISLA